MYDPQNKLTQKTKNRVIYALGNRHQNLGFYLTLDAIWGEGTAQWYKNVLGKHKALGLVLSNTIPVITTISIKEFGIVCSTANGDPVLLHILYTKVFCATLWNEHIRSGIAMIPQH